MKLALVFVALMTVPLSSLAYTAKQGTILWWLDLVCVAFFAGMTGASLFLAVIRRNI